MKINLAGNRIFIFLDRIDEAPNEKYRKCMPKVTPINRLEPLDAEFRAVVNDECGPMMERFDYKEKA